MTNAPQVTALVNQSDLLLDANIDPVGVRGTGGGGGGGERGDLLENQQGECDLH